MMVALPIVLLAIDVLTPPTIRLGSLMVAAPVLSAVFLAPVGVLAVTAVTIVCYAGALVVNEQLSEVNLPIQILTVALISLAAVGSSIAGLRRERELTQSRWVAEMAQRVLLRPLPRRIGSLAISSRYMAAEEQATVGGDLYTAITIGRTVRIMVGDVQGKGLAAVEVVGYLIAAFRRAAREGTPLFRLATYLERSLREDMQEAAAAEAGGGGKDPTVQRRLHEGFVTAVVADLPEDRHDLRLLNCGHPPPMLIRNGEVLTVDGTVGPLPIGLGAFDTGRTCVKTVVFDPGDTLLLYTDGVTEARDASGAFYPLAERLQAWTAKAPDELLAALCSDLAGHVHGRLGDDVALVAIRRMA
jgi:hypothetical protein